MARTKAQEKIHKRELRRVKDRLRLYRKQGFEITDERILRQLENLNDLTTKQLKRLSTQRLNKKAINEQGRSYKEQVHLNRKEASKRGAETRRRKKEPLDANKAVVDAFLGWLDGTALYDQRIKEYITSRIANFNEGGLDGYAIMASALNKTEFDDKARNIEKYYVSFMFNLSEAIDSIASGDEGQRREMLRSLMDTLEGEEGDDFEE